MYCMTVLRVEVFLIRFRLRELVADLEFRRGSRVTLEEVATATGIHRTTLTKIALKRGYNTTTNHLDVLCKFFGCTLDKLAEFVPDADAPVESAPKANKRATTRTRKAAGRAVKS